MLADTGTCYNAQPGREEEGRGSRLALMQEVPLVPQTSSQMSLFHLVIGNHQLVTCLCYARFWLTAFVVIACYVHCEGESAKRTVTVQDVQCAPRQLVCLLRCVPMCGSRAAKATS